MQIYSLHLNICAKPFSDYFIRRKEAAARLLSRGYVRTTDEARSDSRHDAKGTCREVPLSLRVQVVSTVNVLPVEFSILPGRRSDLERAG